MRSLTLILLASLAASAVAQEALPKGKKGIITYDEWKGRVESLQAKIRQQKTFADFRKLIAESDKATAEWAKGKRMQAWFQVDGVLDELTDDGHQIAFGELHALNRPKNPLKTIPVTQHICLNCGLKEGQTLQVTAGDLVLLEGRFDVPKTNVYITRVDVRLGNWGGGYLRDYKVILGKKPPK